MISHKEYFVFISYKSEDAEWAIWLQHELEHYHLPVSFNGRMDIQQELRPVFRDVDELSAGNLPEQIKQALNGSQNLIVVCSPQAAASPWVNQEVETFISFGRTAHIFPFIVDGDSPSEFFPPALLNLPKNEERLGGEVSKNGRDAAFIKIVAGMLDVGFDSLWNRYEKEKAEEERKVREQRNYLLGLQSRFMAKEANELLLKHQYDTASLIALEALPKILASPDRPYVREAEDVLREASIDKSPIIRFNEPTYFNDDCTLAVTTEKGYFIRIWNPQTNKEIKRIYLPNLAPADLDSYQQRNCIFDFISFAPFNGPHSLLIVSTSILYNTPQSCLYLLDYITEKSKLIFSTEEGRKLKNIIVSPNQKYLCCIARYGIHAYDRDEAEAVYVLDTVSFSLVKSIKYHNQVSLSISPDSRFVLSVDGPEIHLQDFDNFSLLERWRSWEFGGKCCFIDETSFVFSQKDNTLRKRDFLSDPYGSESIYFGDSTITDIICKNNLIALSAAKNEIIVIDINNHRVIAKRQWHSEIHLQSFSEDGRKIYFKDKDSFRIWDFYVRSANQRLLYYHPCPIQCAAYSTDRACIISASEKCIKVWDCSEQKVRQTINMDHPYVEQIAIIPDNRAFFSDDGGIWSLELASGNIVKISSNKVLKMLLNPNNKSILTVCEKSMVIYDTITFQEIQQIKLPEGESFMYAGDFCCVEFSFDGDLIASLTYPEDPAWMTATLWDYQTGHRIISTRYEEVAPLSASVAFTPNEDSIVINGCLQWNIKKNTLQKIDLLPVANKIVIDGTELLIEEKILPLQDLIDETRERYKDCHLSAEERKQYFID